jgi:hypothetical protein
MRPDEELLGVVVHSGLVLAHSKDVVAALRLITAFPAGLSLDAVVLARDVHAEAADRREHDAIATAGYRLVGPSPIDRGFANRRRHASSRCLAIVGGSTAAPIR